MWNHPVVYTKQADCLRQLVKRIRRAWGHFLTEHPSIRVILFSAFPEGSPEACYTTPHRKQDFIAEEVSTKMLHKVF